IVIISIPLSILTAFVALQLCGQTINTMTLGGLALAVGMQVDDATVEVENIHRNHAMGKPLLVAILDGASQIAMPTFVGTLAICISFLLLFIVGEDFFPTVDAGMMKLHVRAPTGTRLERTERVVEDVERAIRGIVPADELAGISDNDGIPVSYNLAFYQTDSI